MNDELTPIPERRAEGDPIPTPPVVFHPDDELWPVTGPKVDRSGNPPRRLALAVVTMIIFSMPLGLVAVLFATQVDRHMNRGDVAKAERASRLALTFSIIGIALGSVLLIALLSG